MKKWKISQKQIAVLLTGTYILALIPVLILAFYNYPSADDFGFSAYSHIAWKESHSLWEVLKAACHSVGERYMGWQGTFSTIFVMALQPGIFAEEAYCLVPYIMIGAMTASTMFFLYVVLVKGLKTKKSLFVSVSMLFLLFALEGMIDKTQAFFWFNGAAHYMMPHSVSLVLLGLLLWILMEEKTGIGKVILACLAAVFVGGGNYVSALTVLVIIATFYLVLIYFHQGKRSKRLLLPTVFYVAAFLANVLAPGNAVRQEVMTLRPGVLKSIALSFYYCTEFFSETWMNWTYPVYILLMIPLAFGVVKVIGRRFTYPLPLLVPIYSYCILSSMFTPSLFATGIPGGGRIYNIMYLTYLMLVLLNLVYILGWLLKWAEERGFCNTDTEHNHSATVWFVGIVLCFTLFNAAMYSKVNPDYFTSVSAAKSLVNKEAVAYREQTKERTRLLNDASLKNVELKAYTVKPTLLFFDDVDRNPEDWRNRLACRYYDKDSIILIDNEQNAN